jgi:alpha-tubulin suppressor-like RCC1 family protein
VKAISAGTWCSIALKENGTVVAWGLNYSGKCDVPDGLKSINDDAKLDPEITFEAANTTYAINAVAVIGKEVKDCNGTSSSAEELAAYTENNILAHYDVIDRRHFEDILNEHRIQMSGITIEKTLIENGCIENAQGYLFVRSGCLLGDNMIELRLVHCETSNLVWSCTGVNATAQQVLDKVREELGKE